MILLVPAVEIPHDIDILGIRGPYGKVGPLLALMLHGVGSELLTEAKMTPLVEKVEVFVG
jgi:hypothetical protein